jgi:hypothetical protein
MKWPALALVGGIAATCAAAQEPLSAIDWLSQSVNDAVLDAPVPGTQGTLPTPPGEEPVASGAGTPEITVTPLDQPSPDGVGLLSPAVTGLPPDLWAGSPTQTLTALIRAQETATLPALQDLIVTLMLAEAQAPLDAEADGALFLARVDKLLDMGALDPAQALLEAADTGSPQIFRRWFDVSLLTGTEAAACRTMVSRPGLAPTYPARVFCLAREGEWGAAALTLGTARALGEIGPEDDALLSRFLDPDLYEGEAPLPAPSRPSPLVFRLREAIGQALPTTGLPLAFAHADLRPIAAWRNQMEAAERLARAGAVGGNVLVGAWLANVPAASGGVWDRARAMQALDRALDAGDAGAVDQALPVAMAVADEIGLLVPFARAFVPRLNDNQLATETVLLAFRLSMLTPDYEQAALGARVEEPTLIPIARGQSPLSPLTDAERAVAEAFGADARPPEPLASLIEDRRLGEALLRAVATFQQGLSGDPRAVTDALVTFRAVGLEDVARRAALQYLIIGAPA